MIKFVLLLSLVAVLYSASPRKVSNLPDPVIPTNYQKSKFFYDGSTKASEKSTQDSRKKCENLQVPMSFTEQTLISVAGKN